MARTPRPSPLLGVLLASLVMAALYFTVSLDGLRPSWRSPALLQQPRAESRHSVTEAQHVQRLQEHFLVPPSTLPYNLSEPDNPNPSMGQAQVIDHLLKGRKGGFFIECGGLDGELRSNTLFFERTRGWQGLVIEADPANFLQMTQKHRKAHTSQTCLATGPEPSIVAFAQNSNRGHIQNMAAYDEAPAKGVVEVQCFPLHHYLLALGQTTVDYFSLDVEGAEFKVLQNIPWDRVDIKTLSVEFSHDVEGKEVILRYMTARGYIMYTEVTDPNNLANDFIFVKKELMS